MSVDRDQFPEPLAGPNSIYLPGIVHPRRTLGGRTFDFSREVAVMAIINRTPDSFYDGGRTFARAAAIDAAQAAIAAGADWVDIGGVPFAPGPEVSIDEEVDRVIPVIEALRDERSTVVSVDTSRPQVARRSLEAGAHVINDTSGLHDPAMAKVDLGQVMNPSAYIGRAPQQVEHFVKTVVEPIRQRYKSQLSAQASLRV